MYIYVCTYIYIYIYMGASCLRCPKIGPTTLARFPGSPPRKPRKNAHMIRSSLKLFYLPKISSRDAISPSEWPIWVKSAFFSVHFHLKTPKNAPEIRVWSWIPVMANFGVSQTTLARFSIPPYPDSGKKRRIWKASTKNFFLPLSARLWAIITIWMTKKHK